MSEEYEIENMPRTTHITKHFLPCVLSVESERGIRGRLREIDEEGEEDKRLDQYDFIEMRDEERGREREREGGEREREREGERVKER